VAGSFSDLKSLAEKIRNSRSVAGFRFVEKFADSWKLNRRKF
jgi:hypothetical protein